MCGGAGVGAWVVHGVLSGLLLPGLVGLDLVIGGCLDGDDDGGFYQTLSKNEFSWDHFIKDRYPKCTIF